MARKKSLMTLIKDELKNVPHTKQGHFEVYAPSDFKKALAAATAELEKQDAAHAPAPCEETP